MLKRPSRTSRQLLRTRLKFEHLEARDLPAIAIQIDFSRDTSGFFANNPTAVATLQLAANDLASQISAPLAAITPGGGNTWSESFYDPSTGNYASVSNPSVAANTIVVYAGARTMGGSEVSLGGPGGYSESGSADWQNLIQSRGPASSALWGGTVAFNLNTNWYFGSSASGLQSNQEDFFTSATHELAHVLGFGTSPKWFSYVVNSTLFTGPYSEAVYGGPVPVTWGAGSEIADVTVNGVKPALNIDLAQGVRATFTPLDWSILADCGWSVSGVNAPTSTPPIIVSPPASPPSSFTAPTPLVSGQQPVVLTGSTDGSAQIDYVSSNGTLTPSGSLEYPFPGFTGVIRSAVTDFNGDGTPDYAFATGAGTAAEVAIFDGKTGAAIVPPTAVLGGFTGGAFIAAGDINRNGQDIPILAVSADAGGGPRIAVYEVVNGDLTPLVDFVAFGSPDFRGGARVALGDVNKDGSNDLIVGAGAGGGPRVSIYSGAALAQGQLTSLIPDFFALDSTLRSGVYVTAGDFNGDGYADIAYSTGDTGGPRIRVVSGLELVDNPGADVANLPAMADFFALDPNDRNGIRIAAIDVNGNGVYDLVVGSGNPTNATIRIIPYSQMNTPTTALQDPLASPITVDGVYVG